MSKERSYDPMRRHLTNFRDGELYSKIRMQQTEKEQPRKLSDADSWTRNKRNNNY